MMSYMYLVTQESNLKPKLMHQNIYLDYLAKSDENKMFYVFVFIFLNLKL